MNKQQALSVMNQIQNTFRGTLEEHKIIQAAIAYLSTLVEPISESKE